MVPGHHRSAEKPVSSHHVRRVEDAARTTRRWSPPSSACRWNRTVLDRVEPAHSSAYHAIVLLGDWPEEGAGRLQYTSAGRLERPDRARWPPDSEKFPPGRTRAAGSTGGKRSWSARGHPDAILRARCGDRRAAYQCSVLPGVPSRLVKPMVVWSTSVKRWADASWSQRSTRQRRGCSAGV